MTSVTVIAARIGTCATQWRGSAPSTIHAYTTDAPSRPVVSPAIADTPELRPGLGQMYQGRWVKGLLMILLPIFTVLLAGAFIAIADPLTTLVLRNAPAFTFLVAAAFFVYHLYVVADAFAGKLRGMGSLSGRRLLDYAILGVVCVSLVAF